MWWATIIATTCVPRREYLLAAVATGLIFEIINN
jgi:hypothetical protein